MGYFSQVVMITGLCCLCGGLHLCSAADIRILDLSGKSTDLKSARTDYMSMAESYSGGMGDQEAGLRAYQNSGKARIPWSALKKVVLERVLTVDGLHHLEAECMFRDGQTRQLNLVVPGFRGIVGISDRGEVSMPVEKIREIEVLTERAEKGASRQ